MLKIFVYRHSILLSQRGFPRYLHFLNYGIKGVILNKTLRSVFMCLSQVFYMLCWIWLMSNCLYLPPFPRPPHESRIKHSTSICLKYILSTLFCLSGIPIPWKGNIIGKLRNVGDFHPLKRVYNRKNSTQWKISIGNVGKNRICPSQMSNLFPITLIVWSGATQCSWRSFPSILVTVWSCKCQ